MSTKFYKRIIHFEDCKGFVFNENAESSSEALDRELNFLENKDKILATIEIIEVDGNA
jgi:hypothetical protein